MALIDLTMALTPPINTLEYDLVSTTPSQSLADQQNDLSVSLLAQTAATQPSSSPGRTAWRFPLDIQPMHLSYMNDTKIQLDGRYEPASPTSLNSAYPWDGSNQLEDASSGQRGFNGLDTARPSINYLSNDMPLVMSSNDSISPHSAHSAPNSSTDLLSPFNFPQVRPVPTYGTTAADAPMSTFQSSVPPPFPHNGYFFQNPVNPVSQVTPLPVFANMGYQPSIPSGHLNVPRPMGGARPVMGFDNTLAVTDEPPPLTLEERQKAEEAAYLARQDTKERPPSWMIEKYRREIDWLSLRHEGTSAEVTEELMKMTTKNQKTPEDQPKRPMNAFMIYMSIRRPQIAKSHPRNVNGENSRVLAREWTWYMPETEKQYWLDIADDYRDEFKRRFPLFQYRRTPTSPSKNAGPSKRQCSEPEDEEAEQNKRPRGQARAQSSTTGAEAKADTPDSMIQGWSGNSSTESSPSIGPITIGETPSVLLAPDTSNEGYFPSIDKIAESMMPPEWAEGQ